MIHVVLHFHSRVKFHHIIVPQLIHSPVRGHLKFSNYVDNSNNIELIPVHVHLYTCGRVSLQYIPETELLPQSRHIFSLTWYCQVVFQTDCVLHKQHMSSLCSTSLPTLVLKSLIFFPIKWVWNTLRLPDVVETAPPNFFPSTTVIENPIFSWTKDHPE